MDIPQKLTFREMLLNSVHHYGDLPSLAFVGQQHMTYKEAKTQVDNLQALLSLRGVGKGDRVALLGQNMPNWGVAYLAVTGMGAVVVPILIDFNRGEIGRILEHAETVCVIVSEKQAEKLLQPLPNCLKTAVLLDNLAEISVGQLELNGKVDYVSKDFLKVESVEALLDWPKEDDLAAILYTSGTTGNPKGVMLSHKNILSNAVNTLAIQNVDATDRLLSVLPLPHTYECTIGFVIPFMKGATVYYLDKLPTPAVLLPAMEQVKPTMMLTVPLIIEKVYQNRVLPKLTGSPVLRRLGKFRPVQRLLHKMAGKKIYQAFGGKLHFFGIGGAKLNAATETFLRDAGFPYAIGYGLTETSPLLAGCEPKLTRYRSTGFNLPNQEIRILNPDPHTGEGEIIARGPNVMMGYYKQPDATKEVFTEDGWFKTGDLGYMDDDGFLYIRGRLKNIIVSSTGENIYPEDIEAVINSERHVLESLVYEIKGKLVARVHLNYEEIDKRYLELKEHAEKRYQDMKQSADQHYNDIKDSADQHYQEFKDSAVLMYEQMREKVNLHLHEVKDRVNSRLNRLSHVALVEEQYEPFEKTPTKKIKRFLYQQQTSKD